MLTLKVFHNKIEFQSDVDSDEINKDIFYAKKALNIYYRDSKDRSLRSVYIGRGNSFPAGYLADFVKRIEKKDIKYSIDDKREDVCCSEKYRMSSDLELMRHQSEALERIKEKQSGIISCPTASGKSLIIEKTVDHFSGTTLIIVPNQSIQMELFEKFKEDFGSTNVSKEIPERPFIPELKEEKQETKTIKLNFNRGTSEQETEKDDKFAKIKLKQRQALERKLDRLREKDWHKSITILCYQSLNNVPSWYFKKVQVVIVDECHTASSKTIRDAFYKLENAKYRFGFSATPWRDLDHEEKLMYATLGKDVIYEYLPEQAIEDGVIAKPEMIILNAEAPDKFIKKVKYPRMIIDEGIIRNRNRNLQVVKKALDLYSNNHRVFIAVDEKGHVVGKTEDIESGDVSYSLLSLFNTRGIEVFYISGDDSPEQKREKIEKLRNVPDTDGFIVIGTMSVGIGTDIPPIDKVILASWGKSSIRFIQRIGRGMRKGRGESKTLTIFDFFDWFNDVAKKHSIERRKIFEKYFNIKADY